MTKLGVQQIRALALDVVAGISGGIRYSELVEKIAVANPEMNRNTIHGSVWDLATRFPAKVVKPERGLFKPASGPGTKPESVEAVEAVDGKNEGGPIRERDFYKPFAQFLMVDLDEATEAEALGGSGLKSKWGTPDVVGVYRPRAADWVKFPPEVIAAELKIEPGASIEAFGQAIAYRLFSAKSYIVMPSTITEEDKSRLGALCMLFGIGFVLFKPDPVSPGFWIRTKAQRFSPDMFYVNRFADALKHHDQGLFERLFG